MTNKQRNTGRRSVALEALEQRTLFSDASLVAWYKLDESVGNTAADSSGLNNSGTWVNSPTATAGKIDGALQFNAAASSRVIVADNASLDISDAITLSAWVRPSKTASQYVIKKARQNTTDGYELGLNSDGTVIFRLNQKSAGDTDRVDSTTHYAIDGKTWIHIAGTYDGTTMRLYVNGQLEASKTVSVKIGVNSTTLGIGAQDDGYRGITGAVDDARVYNRALSAQEIADLAAGTVTPPTNIAPVVNAGADQTITQPSNQVTLNGSVTDDGLPGGTLTQQWTVVSKPSGSTVTFGNASATSTTATFDLIGTYVLRLTGSDGALASSDDMQVTVNPAPPPGQVTITAQSLVSVQLNTTTEAKPQNKLWTANGKWWAVLADTSGTWVWRLDGTTWTKTFKLTDDTGALADVRPTSNGNLVHVLIQTGQSMKLASIEYDAANTNYKLWSTRPTIVSLGSRLGLETATIDVDDTGRLWMAYDGTTSVYVRSSTGDYSTWSAEQEIASGIKTDDISTVTRLNGGIGVFWSNQNTKRFGFRVHKDGDPITAWSADEVPAGSAALNLGNGMADDHMNAALAADGTLYMSVKTSYDTAGQTLIGLLVRRPNGVWDQTLYQVDTTGTRPITVINETENALYVFYTSKSAGSDISYKKTSLSGPINFGAKTVAIKGSLDNVTSTKQNTTGDMVVMATNSSHVASSTKYTFSAVQVTGLNAALLFNDDTKIV